MVTPLRGSRRARPLTPGLGPGSTTHLRPGSVSFNPNLQASTESGCAGGLQPGRESRPTRAHDRRGRPHL